MRSIYDNVSVQNSVAPQSISGSSAVNGTPAVDTKGYNTAMLSAYGAAASGAPSGATLACKVQESADGSTGWADALDNTGTAIGFTLTVTSAAATGVARLEGLGLNRKRYLRAVITPTFTGGTTPASIAFAELVLGRGFTKPTNTGGSNT